MSVARKAIAGAGASWLGSTAGFAIRFALNAILLRMIAPGTFGVFAVASVYVEFVAIAISPTFGQAILQLEGPVELTLAGVLQLNAATAAIFLSACLALWPLIAGTDGAEVATLVFWLGLCRAAPIIACTYDNVLQRKLEFARLAALRTSGILVSMAVALAVAWLDHPLMALVLREGLPVLPSAIGLVISQGNVIRRACSRDPEVAAIRRPIFQLGKSIFGVRAVEVVAQRLDQFILARILGSSELALYAQARYLAGLPHAAVTGAVQNVAMQVLVTVSTDLPRMRQTSELLQHTSVHAVALCAVALVFAPHLLVDLAFGSRWADAAAVLPFMAAWVLLVPLAQNAQLALVALREWRALRVAQYVQLLVLAIAAPVLTMFGGMRGTAVSVALPVVAGLVWMRRATPPEARVAASTYRGATAGLASIVPLYVLLPATSNMAELRNGAIASLVYVAVVLVFDRTRVRETVTFLRSRMRRGA